VGRRPTSKELRELIFRMVTENPTWGAPRIHGELKMLGFEISERTVLRWMRKAPRSFKPAKRWAAFLRNHREAIAAMDFFTVPTLTFGVLYCLFVIAHDRRRVLHFNATKHPTSAWVSQQLREAFPYDSAPRYLIFDRDATFNAEVVETAKAVGVKPVRTAFKRTNEVLFVLMRREYDDRRFDVTVEPVQNCKRVILHIVDIQDDEIRSVCPALYSGIATGERKDDVESAVLQRDPEKPPVLLVPLNNKDGRVTGFPCHRSPPDGRPPGCSRPDFNGRARGAPEGQIRG